MLRPEVAVDYPYPAAFTQGYDPEIIDYHAHNTLRQLLELAPTSKLMYSSDAKFIPELYYLAAKWGRQIVAEVLDEAIAEAELTAIEAETIAIAILRQNALDLYH